MNTAKNKERFLEVLADVGGNISAACRHFKRQNIKGFHPSTIQKWRRMDSDFEKKLQIYYNDKTNADVNQIEWALVTLSKGKAKFDRKGEFKEWEIEPDVRAMKLFLEAKAKKLGYGNNESTVTIKNDNRTAEQIEQSINQLKGEAEEGHYDIDKD